MRGLLIAIAILIAVDVDARPRRRSVERMRGAVNVCDSVVAVTFNEGSNDNPEDWSHEQGSPSAAGNASLTNVGVRGASFYLDGTGDYIDVPNSIGAISDFSISLWMYNEKSNYGGNGGIIFARKAGAGVGRNWIFIRAADEVLFTFIGGTLFSMGVNPVENQWYHVCVTHTPGALKAYIDGAEVFDEVETEEGATGDYRIAAHHSTGGDAFMGKMDEVIVYDTVLSADDVAKIYQRGRSEL